jgi:hypothetical protein
MPEIIPLPADDAACLVQLQERIHYAQLATLAVNRECFADAWPDGEFVQVVRAQLPWYHQLALLKHGPTNSVQFVAGQGQGCHHLAGGHVGSCADLIFSWSTASMKTPTTGWSSRRGRQPDHHEQVQRPPRA